MSLPARFFCLCFLLLRLGLSFAAPTPGTGLAQSGASCPTQCRTRVLAARQPQGIRTAAADASRGFAVGVHAPAATWHGRTCTQPQPTPCSWWTKSPGGPAERARPCRVPLADGTTPPPRRHGPLCSQKVPTHAARLYLRGTWIMRPRRRKPVPARAPLADPGPCKRVLQ